jgi:hypothetical protein
MGTLQVIRPKRYEPETMLSGRTERLELEGGVDSQGGWGGAGACPPPT